MLYGRFVVAGLRCCARRVVDVREEGRHVDRGKAIVPDGAPRVSREGDKPHPGFFLPTDVLTPESNIVLRPWRCGALICAPLPTNHDLFVHLS